MKRSLIGFLSLLILSSCAGQTAHDVISPAGKPVGTVLAATQAPIQGVAEGYAEQTARSQANPYGR